MVDQGGDERERVAVFDRPGVYWLVVLDGPKFSIFLLDKEEGCGVGAFRWLDRSSSGVFFEELGEFSLLSTGQTDGFADEGRWGSGF